MLTCLVFLHKLNVILLDFHNFDLHDVLLSRQNNKEIKGLFGEIMPSALVANASLGLLLHFVTSFLQCHFCNVILIHRIILIFRFGQNHRHRPHSCPQNQNLKQNVLLLNCLFHSGGINVAFFLKASLSKISKYNWGKRHHYPQ